MKNKRVHVKFDLISSVFFSALTVVPLLPFFTQWINDSYSIVLIVGCIFSLLGSAVYEKEREEKGRLVTVSDEDNLKFLWVGVATSITIALLGFPVAASLHGTMKIAAFLVMRKQNQQMRDKELLTK